VSARPAPHGALKCGAKTHKLAGMGSLLRLRVAIPLLACGCALSPRPLESEEQEYIPPDEWGWSEDGKFDSYTRPDGGTLPPSDKAIVPPTAEARAELLARARTWMAPDRQGRSLLQGPLQKNAAKRFELDQEVSCTFQDPGAQESRRPGAYRVCAHSLCDPFDLKCHW
jgi:hypothetical protein